MYRLTEQQIDYILRDISARGVEMEDLQYNLLDHVCCIIEQNLEEGGDFERFYASTIQTFYTKELKEIEEETLHLLTFKNYYTMRKIMIITGAVSVAAFIAGSVFKKMFWPGASALLLLAIVSFSFVFLPLFCIIKTREIKTMAGKLVTFAGTLTGILFCMAVLFAIMHWPGNTVFWLSAIACSILLFIPAYFFTGIRNPETRTNTIITSIIMVGVTGLQFSMINLRPAPYQAQIKMHSYIESEQLLKQLQKPGSQPAIAEINNTCEQLKALILQNEIGQTTLPPNFETSHEPPHDGILGDKFFSNGKGTQLLSDLKLQVLKYNATPGLKPEAQVPVNKTLLDVEPYDMGGYNSLIVLNSITQLQLRLASVENKMMAENR